MFSRVLARKVQSGNDGSYQIQQSAGIAILSPCTLPPNMHHRIGQTNNYVIIWTLAYCRGTDDARRSHNIIVPS